MLTIAFVHYYFYLSRQGDGQVGGQEDMLFLNQLGRSKIKTINLIYVINFWTMFRC